MFFVKAQRAWIVGIDIKVQACATERFGVIEQKGADAAAEMGRRNTKLFENFLQRIEEHEARESILGIEGAEGSTALALDVLKVGEEPIAAS